MNPVVSVVMTIYNRADLLEFTLRRYAQMPSAKQAELVVVDDQSTDHVGDVLRTWGERAFMRVRHLGMDKKLSIIPVYHNNPALGINLGVKHGASAEIVVKTDPECFPCCDIVSKAQELFKKDQLLFAEIHRGGQRLNRVLAREAAGYPAKRMPETADALVRLAGVASFENYGWSKAEGPRLPYWFTALFPRSRFMDIGGVDERFLKGFAGEDDEWAERMQRNGSKYNWLPGFVVTHLWHQPPQDRGKTDPEFNAHHEHNKALIQESRDQNKLVANIGHEWGSIHALTSAWQYEAGKNPTPMW